MLFGCMEGWGVHCKRVVVWCVIQGRDGGCGEVKCDLMCWALWG